LILRRRNSKPQPLPARPPKPLTDATIQIGIERLPHGQPRQPRLGRSEAARSCRRRGGLPKILHSRIGYFVVAPGHEIPDLEGSFNASTAMPIMKKRIVE